MIWYLLLHALKWLAHYRRITFHILCGIVFLCCLGRFDFLLPKITCPDCQNEKSIDVFDLLLKELWPSLCKIYSGKGIMNDALYSVPLIIWLNRCTGCKCIISELWYTKTTVGTFIMGTCCLSQNSFSALTFNTKSLTEAKL